MSDIKRNPADVAAELIRAKAAKEGLELVNNFDEQVAEWHAYLEEPVSAPLTWTTEFPTKPGFYWMRELPIEEGCIVRFLPSPEDPEKSDGKFYLTGREYACCDALPGTMWYGPIEPPEI